MKPIAQLLIPEVPSLYRMLLVLVFLGGLGPALADELSGTTARLKIERIASGLDEPWGLANLPDGRFLVTLRGGELRFFQPDGTYQTVRGLPDILVEGQGGLLDVVAARDFSFSRTIFLSYAKQMGASSGTALISARLSLDGSRLHGVRTLFEMKTPSTGGRHFGSRIVEARDGSLFLTLGERGNRNEALNLRNHNGTIVRVMRDGSVPAHFLAGRGLPEIWSYGHRNPQGAALDAVGKLFVVEHGARGGDEVNFVRHGANYGWPVIAYGTHYSGKKIGEGTHKVGMEQPEFYWDPSMAPSGLMIYSGKLWPEWEGDFFVGSLKFDYISRLEWQGGKLREAEKLSAPETGRVRDVREAPDGTIWFLSVIEGAVFRISPG